MNKTISRLIITTCVYICASGAFLIIVYLRRSVYYAQTRWYGRNNGRGCRNELYLRDWGNSLTGEFRVETIACVARHFNTEYNLHETVSVRNG